MGMATSDWENLAQSHRQIIDVLRKRDPEAAERAVQQHIHLAWDETIEKLQARMDGPLRVREF
jgi:DNA-binding GntR family transcriptional regulator